MYTLTHKLEIENNQIKIANTQIQGFIQSFEKSGDGYIVYGANNEESNVSFVNDITFNAKGNLNNILTKAYIIDSLNPIFEFINISKITENTFMCDDIMLTVYKTNINGTYEQYAIYSCKTLEITNNNEVETKIKTKHSLANLSFNDVEVYKVNNNIPVYILGGFNIYDQILKSISIKSISNNINNNINVKYFTDGILDSINNKNTYCIELIEPDYTFGSNYTKAESIKNRPTNIQSSESVIGYEITPLNTTEVFPINRYRGSYNPKFNNVLKFIDTDIIKNELSLSYCNTLISDNSINTIDNLYVHKVNPENSTTLLYENIIEKSYPLIGESAIDKINYNIFSSNWDNNYYTKFTSPTKSISIDGIAEMKNNKSFFGSKEISTANTIQIDSISSNRITLNTIDLSSSSDKILDIDIENILIDFLINDGIVSGFLPYINKDNTLLEDDIINKVRLYIAKNIIAKYYIKQVILWEKTWAKQVNTIPFLELNLSNSDKKTNGYYVTSNFTTSQSTSSDLNLKLIYKIKSEDNTSLSLSLIIEKK